MSDEQFRTPRLGLCCQFVDAPIKFRSATHRYVATLGAQAGRRYLQEIAEANAAALWQAVERCHTLGIGAFRVNSQILPLGTHPESGYALDALDGSGAIRAAFEAAGARAAALDIRLSFHPDQFVVLNSERELVVRSSVAELEFQGVLAELIGADTMVVHAGGASGGVPAALARLARGIDALSDRARARLALENDDRHFAPLDLLPFSAETGVPLVYDAHHHRCHPDGLDVDDATARAVRSWGGREPWMHISSPRDGWGAANPRPHADYIDPTDFPPAWRGMRVTVDVEAKAKERAVMALIGKRRHEPTAEVMGKAERNPGSLTPRPG